MARRPVAWVAAFLLLVEALGLLATAAVLSAVVGGQHMSLAGLEPSAMTAGSWGGCGVGALFLLVCAVALARTAWRDRAPGRAARVLLIVCAAAHGVLGALTVGLVGWTAFALAMIVLGLLVWVLLSYGGDASRPARQDGPPAGAVPPQAPPPEAPPRPTAPPGQVTPTSP